VKQYINVDMELIISELHRIYFDRLGTTKWTKFKPTTKNIDWLFKNYKVVSFIESYYDSDPDFDDEEHSMYMDYLEIKKGKYKDEDIVKKEDLTYSKKEHTFKELKNAHKKIIKLRNDYEPKRIKYLTWQEPFFVGNWDYTQSYITKFAKGKLKEIKKEKISFENRFWILYESKDNLPDDFYIWDEKIEHDVCRLYYYGRDYLGVDYVWDFHKNS